MVTYGACEVEQQALSDLEVGPRFSGDALEQEIGPERCPDEPHVLHRDVPWVDQRHAVLEALSGEFASPHLDVRPVELVVPGHVEDAVGTGPASRDVPHLAGVYGREVAGEDGEFGLGGERRDEVAFEFDVQVGDDSDSDAHAGGRDYSPFPVPSARCSP